MSSVNYQGWFHSAHHFGSFNNKAYLFSVKETREVALKRDGNVKASRWCAGCHDVVPFFSGAFDDPNFDLENHPTSQAGITCTACHAITHINSTVGNADYTIEEPIHYPFAFSTNAVLQFINQQLVKAKPDFHKKILSQTEVQDLGVLFNPSQSQPARGIDQLQISSAARIITTLSCSAAFRDTAHEVFIILKRPGRTAPNATCR
jgi:hypothetical protein